MAERFPFEVRSGGWTVRWERRDPHHALVATVFWDKDAAVMRFVGGVREGRALDKAHLRRATTDLVQRLGPVPPHPSRPPWLRHVNLDVFNEWRRRLAIPRISAARPGSRAAAAERFPLRVRAQGWLVVWNRHGPFQTLSVSAYPAPYARQDVTALKGMVREPQEPFYDRADLRRMARDLARHLGAPPRRDEAVWDEDGAYLSSFRLWLKRRQFPRISDRRTAAPAGSPARPSSPRSVILGITGDVNALDYGGGVIFRAGRDGPVFWEWWDGPLDENGEEISYSPKATYRVYRTEVPDDVFAEYPGADARAVLESQGAPTMPRIHLGNPATNLRLRGRSEDPMERMEVLEGIRDYLGDYTLDPYPEQMTGTVLRRRWASHLKTRRRRSW